MRWPIPVAVPPRRSSAALLLKRLCHEELAEVLRRELLDVLTVVVDLSLRGERKHVCK